MRYIKMIAVLLVAVTLLSVSACANKVAYCPECEEKWSYDYHFCPTCGVSLKGDVNPCAECNEDNVEAAKHCTSCGEALEAATEN